MDSTRIAVAAANAASHTACPHQPAAEAGSSSNFDLAAANPGQASESVTTTNVPPTFRIPATKPPVVANNVGPAVGVLPATAGTASVTQPGFPIAAGCHASGSTAATLSSQQLALESTAAVTLNATTVAGPVTATTVAVAQPG